MNEAEITNVVHKVLQQERLHNVENFDEVVLKTISTILTSFGIDDEDRKEIRADLTYIRKLRKTSDQVSGFAWKAAVTLVISSVLGLLWIGLKQTIGK